MITTKHIDNGYEFYNDERLVAIGCYTSLGFELCELSNDISVHPNGMVGLAFVRNKYTPEFYKQPVSEKYIINPSKVPLSSSKRLDMFIKHSALEGVWPLATERPTI